MTKKELFSILLKLKMRGDFGVKIKDLKVTNGKVKIGEISIESKVDKYDVNSDINIPSCDFLKGLVEGVVKTNCHVVVKDLEIDFDNECFSMGEMIVCENDADYDLNLDLEGNDTVYVPEPVVESSTKESEEDSSQQ